MAELVARVAASFRGRVAVRDDSAALTYGALMAAADKVALILAERGVRPGDLVALALTRSAGYVAAMLGVLRAGAAYVPIDPAEPAARTRAALAGLRVKLLITDGTARLGLRLPQVLVPAPGAAAGPPAGLAGAADDGATGGGDRPCCVMFTSGTTGPPKAVVVPHRGVTTLAWRPSFVPAGPGTVVLAVAPMHFDAATAEIWIPLCNGGTVAVAPRSAMGAGELSDLIKRHGVTVLWLTAGLFRVLADERPDCFDGLRWLLTGGDVVSPGHLRAVAARLPGLRLAACYGPTEATTFTSVAVLTEPPAGPVPLGDPLPGRSLDILDEALLPAPPGEPGELYVSGTGLALGYFGRPGETAARFVADPGEPGRRMYRTGDLARRQPDGSIEFLGRADHQVKIRGVRVEPAEVESALSRHPAVREAVVRARGQAGDAVLAAYLTVRPGEHPSGQALHEFLSSWLPPAMIPSMFVIVDQFPVTPQGKIDGAALSRCGPAGAAVPAPAAATLAELVLGTWLEFLQREIGPDDNVFALGGHSLMALRVAARLERALARRVPLRAVMEHPTPRSLTGWLSTAGPADVTDAQQPRDIGAGVYPLNPAQRSLWFLENFHPHSSFYVVGLGLRFSGPLDAGALETALADCVRRQEALRARFVTLDGRPYQVFAPPGPGQLTLTDLSGQPAHVALAGVRARLGDLAGNPFDLASEPPLRSELVRVAADRHALLLAIHHIVFDAWSFGLLLSELAAGYSALARHEPYAPAPPQPSFGAVCAIAAARADGALAGALPYWRRVLAGAPRLELPTDLVRPGRRGFTGAAMAADIDRDTGLAIRRLAGDQGVSTFTVLLAGFTLMLAQWSGQADVVIGIPLAGRADAKTHELIGFFTSTLPLRVDLTGVRTFREAVRRHREPVLDLLSHTDVPFPLLVEELAPAREGNSNPYYDVTFQHLPAPDAGASFDGLAVDLLPSEWHTAQFDLSCDVFDAGEAFRVQCEFSTEIFSARTIRAQLDHYVALLREAVARPERLPAPRTAALPPDGAQAWSPPWPEGGLAGIVAGWAARTPGAIAVRHRDATLSFSALRQAAARLAGALASAGVGPGDRVGVLLEPAPGVPVTVLAVLMLGAAFVPVDPGFPERRVTELVRIARCRAVVCDKRTKVTAARACATVVDAASESAGTTGAGPAAVCPATAAYVMFTSGSTGEPKPVLVPHRAAIALAAAAAQTYQLTPADVVAQVHALALDVSVEELFGAWYAGAGVALAPDALAPLSPLIREHGVTTLNLAAPRWHSWVRELSDSGERVPAGVRLVVTGSDRLDQGLVRAWHDGPGQGIRLLNAYGTTETAISSAWYDTAGYPADSRHCRSIPIGTAMPHARLHVLDDRVGPVPDGVPGELYVGGPGVVLGYLDQPAATAARFVADPYGPAGARMYRTGDRARRLPGGALEFIGRQDDQVKVRGYRIELAEVESAAATVPGIAEFVAAARPDQAGTVQLIGYVLAAEADPDGDASRVGLWRDVHDADLFNEAPAGADPALHTGGWLSSYTMTPFPDDQMREWRDATLERLLAHPAADVAEIGCGTGMILLGLAGHVRSYLGTDISARSLGHVRAHLEGALASRVSLRLAPADDAAALAGVSPDLVVLNSVIQYFPSAGYLERVLAAAWDRLRPGGRLFIGDVRDLASLRLFHLSVLAARTEAAPALLDAAAERAETDGELCVDPRYFHALAARLPGAAAVDIQVKRGRADTEMNRFRYDVTLWREPLPALPPSAGPASGLAMRDGSGLDREALARLIEGLGGTSAVITSVPDARLAPDLAIAARLGADADAGGAHPDDIRELAAGLGYAAAIRPAGLGLLDVTLLPEPGRPDLASPDPSAAMLDGAALTSDPLRASRRREAADALLDRLRTALPPHMVPSRLVFVPEIPRTASGKVDRNRLPAPPALLDRSRLVPPRTELERALCAAWERALGLAAVGIRDNFFTIGGDSLTWLQVMSRLARAGVSCEVREIFEHQTIEELARSIAGRQR